MADDARDVPIRSVDPDQSSDSLQRVARDVSGILTSGEEILYIALQNVTALSFKKDSAVATSNRLILHRPGVFGTMNFGDYLWEDVRNVKLAEGMVSSSIDIELTDGRSENLGGLDKSQARRFYAIAQQKEQEWREKRRIRDMEEARARAGGVQFAMPSIPPTGAAPSAAAEDPVERLAKAKAMLDQGLISDAEYETLKAKIIASLS